MNIFQKILHFVFFISSNVFIAQIHVEDKIEYTIAYGQQGQAIAIDLIAYEFQAPVVDGYILRAQAQEYNVCAHYNLMHDMSKNLSQKNVSAPSESKLHIQSFQIATPQVPYMLPPKPFYSLPVLYGNQQRMQSGPYCRVSCNSRSPSPNLLGLSARTLLVLFAQQKRYEKYCHDHYHMSVEQKAKLMSTCRYKNFTQQILQDETLSDQAVWELWNEFVQSKIWPFGHDQQLHHEFIKQTLTQRKIKREQIAQQRLEKLCLEKAQHLEKDFKQQELLRIRQDATRVTFDQQREVLPALSDEWTEMQSVYQDYDLCDSGRYEQRKQAVNSIAQDGFMYETRAYTLSLAGTQLIRDMSFDVIGYQTCYGNQLQQIIHQECIDGINRLALLPITSVIYSHKESLVHCFDAVREYNQAGATDKAIAVADLCWSLLDYGKAIVQGAVSGVLGSIDDVFEHPEQAVLCAVAGEYVLAYQLSKILYNVVNIGVTYVFDTQRGKKQWNEYVAPVTQIIDAISNEELSLRDGLKGLTQIAVQWKTQGKLLKGMNKFCKTVKAKALEFAENNPLVAPEQYMVTPEGMIFSACNNASCKNILTDSSKHQKKIGTGGEVISGNVEWSAYSFKHKPPKNVPWKDLAKSTSYRRAFYKPEINIEALELHAWQHGQITTTNKNWKVFNAGKIIGAKSGKETMYMRVECSANTIHGHPILENEYWGYLK